MPAKVDHPMRDALKNIRVITCGFTIVATIVLLAVSGSYALHYMLKEGLRASGETCVYMCGARNDTVILSFCFEDPVVQPEIVDAYYCNGRFRVLEAVNRTVDIVTMTLFNAEYIEPVDRDFVTQLYGHLTLAEISLVGYTDFIETDIKRSLTKLRAYWFGNERDEL